MRSRMIRTLYCILLLSPLVSTGCRQNEAGPSATGTVPIPVSQPVRRQVTDYVDFTGQTDAVESVNVRARVTGYLETMPFQEGREVTKGETLFTIDARPYKAQLDQQESQVKVNEASLNLAKATLARDQKVNQDAPGAVSQQQVDQDQAALLEADARLKASKSSTEVYKLNLEFTKVTSPIDGMVSRYYFTRGNLVIQDQTLLTTVVSLDPMYVYFNLDETTRTRIVQGVVSGKIINYKDRSQAPVYFGLQGEDGYPHQGNFDFINNVFSPSTGSVSSRAKVANPKIVNPNATQGVRLLMPGMFVRVRLPIGQPHDALLVIDRALSSDQGIKYLYVLDKNNKAQYRKVTTGALQPDGLRVIETGLQPDDWVVVSGLQQVRPQMVITPDRQPMPTIGGSIATETSPGAPGPSAAPTGPAPSGSAPAASSAPPASARAKGPNDSGKVTR
jgi:multidrug efflux system membrane fusion protein